MSKWLKAAIAAVLLLPVVSWYAERVIDPLEAARDGSGNYTVPNTFSPGDTITASDFNQNFSDMGAEVTNSLPRDGQAGMTGQFKATNGTAALPGISFASDTNTGLYRVAADQIGVSVNGTQVATFSSSGFSGEGGAFTAEVSCGARSSAPTGWLVSAGATIGNASSGGTARANADTEDLFTELWNSFANAELPIQDSAGSASTRGASASADFDANKRMPLPDLSGRVVAGLEASATRLTSAVSGVDGATLGDAGGSESFTLAQANLPNVNLSSDNLSITGSPSLTGFTTSITRNLSIADDIVLENVAAGGGENVVGTNKSRFSFGSTNLGVNSGTLDAGGTVPLGGSGTAKGHVQSTYILNCFIKL